MAESQEHRRNMARVIANAWMDPGYLERLKSDPHAALTEAGVKVPSKQVRVVEDSDEVTHLVIPKRPAGLEEHRRKHKAHPGICSDNPQICSAHPELCSTAEGESPRPEICSFL